MRADEQWGTYFTAAEALEHKLIDVVIPNKGQVKNAVNFETMGMQSATKAFAHDAKAKAMRSRLVEVQSHG